MRYNMPKFHQKICKIKDIFKEIVTVKGLLTNVLKHSAINYLSLKELFKLLKKKQVTIISTYTGIASTELKVKLHKTFKQLLPACKLRLILKTSSCMGNCFNFKNKTKQELRSLLVYNFKCNSYNDESIGKT